MGVRATTLFRQSKVVVTISTRYVVGDKQGNRVACPDLGSGRRLRDVGELMHLPLAIKSNLTRAEVIAVVLYTGPMVYSPPLPQS